MVAEVMEGGGEVVEGGQQKERREERSVLHYNKRITQHVNITNNLLIVVSLLVMQDFQYRIQRKLQGEGHEGKGNGGSIRITQGSAPPQGR